MKPISDAKEISRFAGQKSSLSLTFYRYVCFDSLDIKRPQKYLAVKEKGRVCARSRTSALPEKGRHLGERREEKLRLQG